MPTSTMYIRQVYTVPLVFKELERATAAGPSHAGSASHPRDRVDRAAAPVATTRSRRSVSGHHRTNHGPDAGHESGIKVGDLLKIPPKPAARRNTQEYDREILHHLHIMHNLFGLWLLELVTVFARGLKGEHIVAVAQPMGIRLSRFVKHKSAAGIAESTAIKTQVF